MGKSPCQHCTKRYPGCHANCKDGIAWDIKERERRARIAAERKKDSEAIGCSIELKERVRKDRGRR